MAEKMPRKEYERARLHLELVKLQYWIKQGGERVVLLATPAAGSLSVTRRASRPRQR
jgi:hypothetical protein